MKWSKRTRLPRSPAGDHGAAANAPAQVDGGKLPQAKAQPGDPVPPSRAVVDIFPTTQDGWFVHGRHEVNRHIMTMYAWPLKVYFSGSRDRDLGEPDEVINGFFESRLEKEDYFEKWRASGLRLRRWLMNGLCLYLHELRRQKIRNLRAVTIDEDCVVTTDEDHQQMDRYFGIALVQRALVEIEKICATRRQDMHWKVFVQHRFGGRSYAEIAVTLGVKPERAAVMNRTVEQHVEKAIRDLLQRDGVPLPRINEEIQALLEATGR